MNLNNMNIMAILELEKNYHRIIECLCFLPLIKQIQKKYHFENSFDFYGWLINIKQWMEGIKEHEDIDQYRKRKEMLSSVQESISKLIDQLELGDSLHEPTILFQIAIEKELNVIPDIEAKRPTDTYVRRLISFLLMMYTDGSEEKVSCYYNQYKSCYYGQFYYFMIDMLPALHCLGIVVDVKIETLGGL